MSLNVRHIPVFGLVLLTILMSGCLGYHTTGTSGVPVTMPTSNPTAYIINVTVLPSSATTGQIIGATSTSVPTQASPTPLPEYIARIGDNVSVDYTGWDGNGSIFDTTNASIAKDAGIYDSRKIYAPTVFVIGSGSVISGFNDAVIGMTINETKNVTLPPEQAYGEHNESLVRAVPLSILNNAGIYPKVGQTIYCNHQPVKVLEIKDNNAMIDFNSPFVGQTLQFNITLLSIQHMNTS